LSKEEKKLEKETKVALYDVYRILFENNDNIRKDYEMISIDNQREKQRNFLKNCPDDPIFISMIK
jgi:acyl-[acyl carrier protein]--UDP-N-acetylglucosamine O-acyltransferase